MMNETNLNVSDADLDAILAAAADLEDEVVALDAELEDEFADEATEEDMIAAVGEIEAEEARAEAYKDQEGTTDATPDESDAPKKAKGKRLNTANMKPSEVVRAKLGDAIYTTFLTKASDATLGDAALRAEIDSRIDAIDALPKKVGEKVVNMLYHISSGVSLSCYTKIAIDVLKGNGSATSKDIRDAYLKRPYSAGTANAQSSQMMALLPFMGIASKSGNSLELKADCPLVSLL